MIGIEIITHKYPNDSGRSRLQSGKNCHALVWRYIVSLQTGGIVAAFEDQGTSMVKSLSQFVTWVYRLKGLPFASSIPSYLLLQWSINKFFHYPTLDLLITTPERVAAHEAKVILDSERRSINRASKSGDRATRRATSSVISIRASLKSPTRTTASPSSNLICFRSPVARMLAFWARLRRQSNCACFPLYYNFPIYLILDDKIINAPHSAPEVIARCNGESNVSSDKYSIFLPQWTSSFKQQSSKHDAPFRYSY
jgi:hypothetical protein